MHAPVLRPAALRPLSYMLPHLTTHPQPLSLSHIHPVFHGRLPLPSPTLLIGVARKHINTHTHTHTRACRPLPTLFMSVALSTVIFLPMDQLGWLVAWATVTLGGGGRWVLRG
mgnify:CR=1 FL=1